MQRAQEGEGPTQFGFSIILRQMRIEEGLFDIVLNRIGSVDGMMGLYRIVSLPVSSLLTTDTYWGKFTSKIVRLSVPKAAVWLMRHFIDP